MLLVEGLALFELDALRFVDTLRFVSALLDTGGGTGAAVAGALAMKCDAFA